MPVQEMELVEDKGYNLINTVEKLVEFNKLLDSLPDLHIIGYDHEATGLYFKTDVVTGTSFSWEEGCAVYLPYWHSDREEWGFGRKEVRETMSKLKRFRVVGHKIVFDTTMSYATFGINVPIWDDTYLLAKLLEKPLALDEIALHEFGVKRDKFTDVMIKLFGKTWKSQGMTAADARSDEISDYACGDADDTRRAYYRYKPLLAKHKLTSLHKIEVNILPLVRRMNSIGAPVDPETAALISELLTKQNNHVQQQIYDAVGFEFKINSPKDCPHVLFDVLKLPVLSRSKKTGVPSTDKDTMEALSTEHPVVPLIKQWREDTRLNTAYMAKIPKMVTEVGRVHTEFNSFAAASGRFTSSSSMNSKQEKIGFNLQNISKKGIDLEVPDQKWLPPEGQNSAELGDELHRARFLMEKGYTPLSHTTVSEEGIIIPTHWKMSVREMFVAPPGWVWVKADLSQVEYRLLANIAQEPYLIERFNAGQDFHTTTAAIFLDILDEEVTKAQRTVGKVVNFTMAYGGSSEKVAKTLKISEEEAERGFNRYWERLPKVAQLAAFCRKRAQDQGITKTFFGLVRSLKMHGIPHKVKQANLRKSLNTLIQGSAAEFLKLGMLRTADYTDSYYKAKQLEVILSVHDEQDFLIREEVLFETLPLIKRGMEIETPDDWCDLKVDIGYGPNWSEDFHTVWETPADYKPTPFTGWANVLPKSCTSHAEV